MIAIPLILLLLSRGISANQARLGARNDECFSATVTGERNYNACCSGADEGIGKVTGADGTSQAFHYACASYMDKDYEYLGEFNSARACAEACADNPSCHAGAWDSRYSTCVTTSSTDPEFVPDKEKLFLRFVKVPESELPPAGGGTGATECDDQVADARLVCENEQDEKCKTRMETQKQDLRSQCDQRVEDQCKNSGDDGNTAAQCKEEKSALEKSLRSRCEAEKDNAKKQWEKNQAAQGAQDRKARDELENRLKQLQKQEAERKKKADEDKKALDKLQQENEQLKQRHGTRTSTQPTAKETPTTKPSPKQPPKPADRNSVHEIPPLKNFNKKCSDFEGQEYTVLGVTYQVFCGMHPDDGAEPRKEWRARNPSFLMGVCSTTPGCQGVKLRENFSQLSFKHDFPPSKGVERKYWSLVPKEPRADNDASAIRSEFMDNKNGVRCPEVDGQIVTLGDTSYQLNCNRRFNVNRAKNADGAKTFQECLVSCHVTKGCQGVVRDNYCSNFFSHQVLPAETPEKDQSKGDTKWVATLRDTE